jgi:hypothetical protein
MTAIGGDVFTQSRHMSSGTLASLSGFCKYVQVDKIYLGFIEFCEENNERYETWESAWRDFWPIYQTTPEYKLLGCKD